MEVNYKNLLFNSRIEKVCCKKTKSSTFMIKVKPCIFY